MGFARSGLRLCIRRKSSGPYPVPRRNTTTPPHFLSRGQPFDCYPPWCGPVWSVGLKIFRPRFIRNTVLTPSHIWRSAEWFEAHHWRTQHPFVGLARFRMDVGGRLLNFVWSSYAWFVFFEKYISSKEGIWCAPHPKWSSRLVTHLNQYWQIEATSFGLAHHIPQFINSRICFDLMT